MSCIVSARCDLKRNSGACRRSRTEAGRNRGDDGVTNPHDRPRLPVPMFHLLSAILSGDPYRPPAEHVLFNPLNLPRRATACLPCTAFPGHSDRPPFLPRMHMAEWAMFVSARRTHGRSLPAGSSGRAFICIECQDDRFPRGRRVTLSWVRGSLGQYHEEERRGRSLPNRGGSR